MFEHFIHLNAVQIAETTETMQKVLHRYTDKKNKNLNKSFPKIKPTNRFFGTLFIVYNYIIRKYYFFSNKLISIIFVNR